MVRFSFIDNELKYLTRNTETTTSTNKTAGNNKTCQTRSWIVGNKIIQIKTGLFANICNEDPVLSLTYRKQRLSSSVSNPTSNSNVNNKTNSSSIKTATLTQAINIPMHKNLTHVDSYESSESSNNSSFTSQNLAINNIGPTSHKHQVLSELRIKDFFKQKKRFKIWKGSGIRRQTTCSSYLLNKLLIVMASLKKMVLKLAVVFMADGRI